MPVEETTVDESGQLREAQFMYPVKQDLGLKIGWWLELKVHRFSEDFKEAGPLKYVQRSIPPQEMMDAGASLGKLVRKYGGRDFVDGLLRELLVDLIFRLGDALGIQLKERVTSSTEQDA